jgi:hypothetical protein
MSRGTLSESRIGIAPIASPNTIPTPDISTPDVSKPDKNTPLVPGNVVVTTATPPTPNANDGLVPKPTPEPSVLPTPTILLEPSKKPCAYCMAKRVTNLAFQISMVLLVLALSFHLVKKV